VADQLRLMTHIREEEEVDIYLLFSL